MPEDLMRYDLLAQHALLGVVREALRRVEKLGLPGDHHFYIAIDTQHPGVDIGERMLQRYPREMTVILQHQFENLGVWEDRFEVQLSFDEIPEKLVIPFAAVKGFLDPYVQFGLQFEVSVADASAETGKSAAAGEESVADDPDKPKVVSLDSFRKK